MRLFFYVPVLATLWSNAGNGSIPGKTLRESYEVYERVQETESYAEMALLNSVTKRTRVMVMVFALW